MRIKFANVLMHLSITHTNSPRYRSHYSNLAGIASEIKGAIYTRPLFQNPGEKKASLGVGGKPTQPRRINVNTLA